MRPGSSAKTRVEGLDVARSVAILAMVLINFQVFLLAPPSEQLDDLTWRWLIHLPSGRSSALFVTLAGAGIGLMARAYDLRAVRFTLLKRALFLLIAGNLLILVWWIDILHFYAFYLAFAGLVFLDFSRRQLLGAAVCVALFAGLLDLAFEWPDAEYHSLVGMPVDIFVDGIHPVLPWIAFVLVGMWLVKHDLREAGVRRRLMLGAAVLAAMCELVSVAAMALATQLAWPSEVAGALGTGWSPEPLYVVGASSTSVLVITLCQEATSRWGASNPVRALVATGQLSLSIYILHALVGVGVPRWLMGLDDAVRWRPVLLWWFVFCALVVPGAWAYRSRLSRGPLEWVMRKLCGNTPSAPPRPTAAPTRSPPAWPWAFVFAAALAVAAVKVVGITEPTWGCGEPIALGPRVASELTLTCPRRAFTLEIEETRTLTLETESSLDVLIELWGPSKRIAVDDDSGDHLNARLTRELGPGRYRVVVRPYHRSLGPFALVFD